jgi:hypothetical protein
MLSVRTWAFLLVVATPASAALAQAPEADQAAVPLRASLLTAEREQKATATSPPQRGKVERALYRYDTGFGTPFLFQSWHGLHLGASDFPAGAGIKFGVGYTHDIGPARAADDPDRPNRLEVDGVAAYGTRGYSRGAAGLNVHHLGGAPLELRVRGQHYEFDQQDFFGFGPHSSKDNRTNYMLKSTEVNGELSWMPKDIEITGGIGYLKPRLGQGTDRRFPSIGEFFAPESLPGIERQPDFLRSDASIAFDWRDNPLHPHNGGRYGAQFSEYDDRDFDAFGFHRVAIDLQQFVPVPDRYHTIALHGAAVFTDPRQGQTVPFYFQPTLGGAEALRGFREFRFQDRNSLLMTAEYRWEAWWALDGALFVDAGEVATNRRDFTFRNLDVSYGFGLRFHSNSAFVARLDLAFSREGFIPLLRFEHAF